MVVWRLKKGMDRRFRAGHPWVYSNELQESPKGVLPGQPVELQDAGGAFLARGYGNPNSLIAFRALSRDASESEPLSREGIERRLRLALALRLPTHATSFRWAFGEADELPGLILDRYLLESSVPEQAIVLQAHTAGMDRAQDAILDSIEALVKAGALGSVPWEKTSIVLRNDVGVRVLEGIGEGEARIYREASGAQLRSARIRVGAHVFGCDLVGGQKTGFFLDQAENAARFSRLWAPAPDRPKDAVVRILDLCCYVGQWSVNFASALRARGYRVECTLVDASGPALELARANVVRLGQGVEARAIQGDVLKDLESLESASFDVVIADPPALIKGRKAIHAGTHAYLQLNTQAFRLARAGGAVVSSSCSALLEETAFTQALSKATARNHREIRWIARGGQAPDHPVRLAFPEGQYLKAWLGGVVR